jgi:hypothetical protein
MTRSKLATAISAALLTFGTISSASAHDIIGGVIKGGGNHDVYRTTCFGWNTSTVTAAGPTVSYDTVAPATETSGHSAGFRFAVNLYPAGITTTAGGLATLKNDVAGVNSAVTTTASSVSATVGFVGAPNISNALQHNNPADPNNYGPDYNAGTLGPTANFQTASLSVAGTPWTNTTTEPDFTTAGVSPTGWSTAKYVNVGTGLGDGEYIITIENTQPTSATTNVLGYDFTGHCQNAATQGAKTSVHTGQGVWFVPGTAPGTYTSSADYDQVIDQ